MMVTEFAGTSFTSKPWGCEYLVCTSPDTALWCLRLNRGVSTSFHCHPIKRTGYVVVEGEVHIEFLSSTRILKAGEFINFRPGLFHKTTALTETAIVLEIESPNKKQDLLRLEDMSGRSSSTIETPDHHRDAEELPLLDAFSAIFKNGGRAEMCNLKASLLKIESVWDAKLSRESRGFLMVLDGVFLTNQSYPLDEPQRLLGPGDVISVSNLFRMEHVIDRSALDVTGILFEAL